MVVSHQEVVRGILSLGNEDSPLRSPIYQSLDRNGQLPQESTDSRPALSKLVFDLELHHVSGQSFKGKLLEHRQIPH